MATKYLKSKLRGLLPVWSKPISGDDAAAAGDEEAYYQDNYLSYATLTVEEDLQRDSLALGDNNNSMVGMDGSRRISYQQNRDESMNRRRSSAGSIMDGNNNNYDYSHQADPAHGTSTMTVATFNLVATIVGGGVLSVPFAFQKCGGALWGVLWMILAACATDQSCVMLCWCARPNMAVPAAALGGDTTPLLLSSYGQVGKAAFGPVLEVAISALLCVFLIFVLIAYMVLVKDIWTPILISLYYTAATSAEYHGSSMEATTSSVTLTSAATTLSSLQEAQDAAWGPYVLIGIVVFMSPFLVQRSLHALRFNCYIGFASVSMLCLALCHHALSSSATGDNSSTTANVLWTQDFWLAPPESIQDVITAFPILMLSFLCHFNVNPIQKALIHPTPVRVNGVIHGAMFACSLLMTIFGVAGYAYVVGSEKKISAVVQGNILLNCEEEQQSSPGVDLLLWLGRVGCGITIMLAMAMMLLPCRDSLLEVLDIISCAGTSKDRQNDNAIVSEDTPLVGLSQEGGKVIRKLPSLSEIPTVHYGSTLLIVVVCYVSAVKAPGVAIVWSLCGSSMAFCIAFVLPTACFLQILHKQGMQLQEQTETPTLLQKLLAWVLLATSIVAAIVCTTQTIESMIFSNDPIH